MLKRHPNLKSSAVGTLWGFSGPWLTSSNSPWGRLQAWHSPRIAEKVTPTFGTCEASRAALKWKLAKPALLALFQDSWLQDGRWLGTGCYQRALRTFWSFQQLVITVFDVCKSLVCIHSRNPFSVEIQGYKQRFAFVVVEELNKCHE